MRDGGAEAACAAGAAGCWLLVTFHDHRCSEVRYAGASLSPDHLPTETSYMLLRIADSNRVGAVVSFVRPKRPITMY